MRAKLILCVNLIIHGHKYAVARRMLRHNRNIIIRR